MRADYLTRFKQVSDAPVDKVVTGVRMPLEVGERLCDRAVPSKRSEWLRRVISEAAKRELVQNQT